MKLDEVKGRERLKYRPDPYWHRISEGRYVGYRKMTPGRPGTWLARVYDGAKYQYRPLDDEINELPEKQRFDAAKKKAEEFFAHLDKGGSAKPVTVREACAAYLEMLKRERSEQAAKETGGYFKRFVFGDAELKIAADPIAHVKLDSLSKPMMSAYRARLLAHNEDKASFNRNVTPIRAALNFAKAEGYVASDQAWAHALRAFDTEELGDRSRKEYLDSEQRRRLVDNASEEAQPLFKALALLPMRPGEVASLKVEHLSVREVMLNVPKGKTAYRAIPLSSAALAHFKQCATADKLPSAWLVSRADGSQWKKEQWKKEVKAAARKAKLPRSTVAYVLRHSVITDLIVGGLDIFTVSKLAGTSVRMIEKTYGKLISKHAREHLDKLALA